MKFLLVIGAILILVGTPLTVIALGKKQGCAGTAAGCVAGTVVAKNKAQKQRAGEARERRQAKIPAR